MGISLIFKIAAVGILVTILSQILKHSGREEHCLSFKPCRAYSCSYMGDSVHI